MGQSLVSLKVDITQEGPDPNVFLTCCAAKVLPVLTAPLRTLSLDVQFLLDESDGIQAEMRVGSRLNQSRRLLARLTEPNIMHGHSQQFTAHPGHIP